MKQVKREAGAIRAENVRIVSKPLTETYSHQGSITLGGGSRALARKDREARIQVRDKRKARS